MPPKFKFSKNEIIDMAYTIIKEQGLEALTARYLGEKLHSSSKIIFGSFANMEELKKEVIQRCYDNISKELIIALEDKSKLGYISCGLAYIKFARDNPNIYKFFVMRDRSEDNYMFKDDSLDKIIEVISKRSKLTLEEAKEAHLKYWFYMHGIATVIVYSNLILDDDYIEQLLKEDYEATVEYIINRRDK